MGFKGLKKNNFQPVSAAEQSNPGIVNTSNAFRRKAKKREKRRQKRSRYKFQAARRGEVRVDH